MLHLISFLPGFSSRTGASGSHRSPQPTSPIAPVQALWGEWLEPIIQKAIPKRGPGSRNRLWPASLVFWAFLTQVLNPATACREIVRQIAAWAQVSAPQRDTEDSDSAYCQARSALPVKFFLKIALAVARHLQNLSSLLWCDFEVFIVDGSTLTAPDTPKNQARWPQPTTQKPGCGFPQIRLLSLFSLATGALLRIKVGARDQSEQRLFARLWRYLPKGSLVLADRNFCSFVNIAALLRREVQSVFRLHGSRSHDLRKGKKLGKNDRLLTWTKPRYCPDYLWAKIFALLPKSLSIRVVRVSVTLPGFRTRRLYLATTLLDSAKYSPQQLAQLYRQRWRIELGFRCLKTILRLDHLRCKSPNTVYKEILVHWIAYNLVRYVLWMTSQLYAVDLQRLSFKGALDTVRHYSCALEIFRGRRRKTNQILSIMYYQIAHDPVPDRPDRVEPRAVKRRPKAYPPLTKPRHKMKVVPHANYVYAKAAKLRRKLS